MASAASIASGLREFWGLRLRAALLWTKAKGALGLTEREALVVGMGCRGIL